MQALDSFEELLFQLSVWLQEPQLRYQEALEQGYNVEFYQVVSTKRQPDDNHQSENPQKPPKVPKANGKPKFSD